MKNRDSWIKIIQSLILVFGAIWIGSQISKILTIYYFFQTDDFGRVFIKPELTNSPINLIAYQFVPIFSTSIISYILFILFLISYVILIRKELKYKGWLFISIVIIILCLPFEIYLGLIDFKIFDLAYNRIGNSEIFINLFTNRVVALSSFPVISIFLHIFTLFLIVFKPLNKEKKSEN